MPIFRDSKRDNPSEMGMLGGGDGMRIGLVRRVGRVCAAEAGGGGIIALRRPRPYSRRLRGWRCDPNAAIAASIRIPCHTWRP